MNIPTPSKKDLDPGMAKIKKGVQQTRKRSPRSLLSYPGRILRARMGAYVARPARNRIEKQLQLLIIRADLLYLEIARLLFSSAWKAQSERNPLPLEDCPEAIFSNLPHRDRSILGVETRFHPEKASFSDRTCHQKQRHCSSRST